MAKNIDAIFVHYSTNYVFSGDKKEGYMETDIPSPINKYGESKLAGEEAVKKVKDAIRKKEEEERRKKAEKEEKNKEE